MANAAPSTAAAISNASLVVSSYCIVMSSLLPKDNALLSAIFNVPEMVKLLIWFDADVSSRSRLESTTSAFEAVIFPAVTPKFVASRPPLIADDVRRLSNSLLSCAAVKTAPDENVCTRDTVPISFALFLSLQSFVPTLHLH